MLRYLFSLLFKLVQLLFGIGLWLFGLGLWLWYPLRWWPGDSLPPVQLLNYFMPWLLAAIVPALGIATLARRKFLAVTLAVPALIIIFSYLPLFLPRPRAALADNNAFKVMSYNIWWHNRDLTAAVALIKREQPDILLLQEVRPYMAQELKQELADLYPGQELHFLYAGSEGQAVVSRYPLTPLESSLQKGRNQKVRVETPGGYLQVWNVHLSQPFSWRRHTAQVKSLTREASEVDEPLIIGGDFNTTDQSEMYRALSQHLSNAHWEAGWGFGFTFPSSKMNLKGELSVPSPLIRIDHLFYNEGLFVQKAGTLPTSGGSDHLPITAKFLLVK
jgi:endonuclease/exonuclease/phosphatase (EEP) superfamily protein YafD